MMTQLEELVARLREEAELLRRRGLEREAKLEDSIADEVEIALRAYTREELDLRQAAAESGYSRKRLRELVRSGKLPDVRPQGSSGPIRIRRCDLPRKPAGDRDHATPVDRLEARVRSSRP